MLNLEGASKQHDQIEMTTLCWMQKVFFVNKFSMSKELFLGNIFSPIDAHVILNNPVQ